MHSAAADGSEEICCLVPSKQLLGQLDLLLLDFHLATSFVVNQLVKDKGVLHTLFKDYVFALVG